jgi:hypothetical protein
MVEVTKHEHGRPSWVDLGTPDPEAGKAFYTGLFGWEWTDEPTGDGGLYTMFRLGGRDVAALYAQREDERTMGIPPHWLVYITVDDVDLAAGRVAGAGGTLLAEPFDVLDSGRMAMVQDPAGAVFALWQAGTHIGSQRFGEPGSVTWFELNSRDAAVAERFYTELLGWTSEVMPMQGMDYTVFSVGGSGAAGMLQMTEEWGDLPSHWMVYFEVADCDAAAQRAVELGGANPFPPMEVPEVGRWAVVSDPQGAHFSIMTSAPQPSS